MNDEPLVQLLIEAQEAPMRSKEREEKVHLLWQELNKQPGLIQFPSQDTPIFQHIHAICERVRSEICNEIDQFKPMSNLRMKLADWLKERLYQAYDEERIFSRLLDELDQSSPESVEQRKQTISKLLSYLIPLLIQYHRSDYQEGLNITVDRLATRFLNKDSKSLNEDSKIFQPQLPSVTQSLVHWVNSHQSWNKRNVIKEEKTIGQNSLDKSPSNDEQGSILDQTPAQKLDGSPVLAGIEELIEKEQAKNNQRIGQQVEQYIRKDPESKLQACYPGNPPNPRHPDTYPECNCQILAIWRLLTDSPKRFGAIAQELNIAKTKVETHWYDRCLPLLREIARGFGYEPSNERAALRRGLHRTSVALPVQHYFSLIQQSQKMMPPTILLSQEALQQAMQFAIEQSTFAKGKQVYLNTLAIHAVQSWLWSFQIETLPLHSDCLHPGLRAMFNVADLYVSGMGRLECRPILPGESLFAAPTEITPDLIGCVAVQFSNNLSEVKLLGFVPSAALQNKPEEVSLTEIQPLTTLTDQFQSHQVFSNHTVLSKWLQDIFTGSWQSLESLMQDSPLMWSPARFAKKDHSQIKSCVRGKRIELEGESVSLKSGERAAKENYALAFVVSVTPQDNEKIQILLQLRSLDEQCLPANVQLVVLDESGKNVAHALSGEHDGLIQQKLRGKSGEKFDVELKLGSSSLLEKFIV
jgi:Protein of unknown function (DUF1822)